MIRSPDALKVPDLVNNALEGDNFNSQEIDKIKKDSKKIRDAISLRNEIDSIIEFVEIT